MLASVVTKFRPLTVLPEAMSNAWLLAPVIDTVGVVPEEPVPFAGYLGLSAVIVPVGWRHARGSARGWDAATFALAAAALCVLA